MRPASRVVSSADGYLYLVGGTNSAIDLFDPKEFERTVPLELWAHILRERNTFFEATRIPWVLLLSPEKLSIYGQSTIRELVGEGFRSPGESFIQHFGTKNILYPRDFLTKQSKTYQLYPKTDSHWTHLGAFCAFQLLQSALGCNLDSTELQRLPNVELSYFGDLWSPEFPEMRPETFIRKKVPASIRAIYVNPVVGLKESRGLGDEPALHAGSHLIFFNAQAQRRGRVILFGSSFSEYRLDCSLLTFIFCMHFDEVHFIWSTNLDYDYISRLRPALVVVETPERFITQCPRDDLCIEAVGADLAKKWREREQT
jgi:alginate O-acetyltransferase complex protein AlgJ